MKFLETVKELLFDLILNELYGEAEYDFQLSGYD